jgi:hypothetical protein
MDNVFLAFQVIIFVQEIVIKYLLSAQHMITRLVFVYHAIKGILLIVEIVLLHQVSIIAKLFRTDSADNVSKDLYFKMEIALL